MGNVNAFWKNVQEEVQEEKEGLHMKHQGTEELLEKMKAAKTAEQMFEIAQELGLDLTKEKAKEYFELLNQGG